MRWDESWGPQSGLWPLQLMLPHSTSCLSLSSRFSSSLRYDVFLSHKRTDAKDFARALYNLLALRGMKTFLDYE